jgi:hypothetical protein
VNGDALRPQRPRQPDPPHARAQARTSRTPRGIHPGDRCCLCGQPIWPLPDGKTGNLHADHDPGTTQYRGLANGTKCEQCGRSSSCGFLRNGRVPNESARLYKPTKWHRLQAPFLNGRRSQSGLHPGPRLRLRCCPRPRRDEDVWCTAYVQEPRRMALGRGRAPPGSPSPLPVEGRVRPLMVPALPRQGNRYVPLHPGCVLVEQPVRAPGPEPSRGPGRSPAL